MTLTVASHLEVLAQSINAEDLMEPLVVIEAVHLKHRALVLQWLSFRLYVHVHAPCSGRKNSSVIQPVTFDDNAHRK